MLNCVLKSYVIYIQRDFEDDCFNEFGTAKTSYYHYINPYCFALSHSMQLCVWFPNTSVNSACCGVEKSLQSCLMAVVFPLIMNKVWLPFSWASFQPTAFGGEEGIQDSETDF